MFQSDRKSKQPGVSSILSNYNVWAAMITLFVSQLAQLLTSLVPVFDDHSCMPALTLLAKLLFGSFQQQAFLTGFLIFTDPLTHSIY